MDGPKTDDSDDAIAAINIIPLVDVVLVLLIIFMVTTVFTRDSALKLDLPKGSRPDVPKVPPPQVTVSVDKTGAITVNNKLTRLQDVDDRVAALINKNADTLLVLKGDKDVVYGKLMPVLDEVSRTGVKITLALQAGPPPQ